MIKMLIFNTLECESLKTFLLCISILTCFNLNTYGLDQFLKCVKVGSFANIK